MTRLAKHLLFAGLLAAEARPAPARAEFTVKDAQALIAHVERTVFPANAVSNYKLTHLRKDQVLKYNIDASKIEEKITDKTRAIIPVHLHGLPADMDEIMAIASKHNLIVIEDACQAHGAEYRAKRSALSVISPLLARTAPRI